MIRRFSLTVLALASMGLAPPAFAAKPAGLHVVDTISGPDGGWDYASFDAARGRVYVAHGSSVMMIDVATGKVTPDFAAGNHLHAVVPVPGSILLVTTNGDDVTAKIIDAQSGKLIASIPTPKDPDSAIYDPHTRDGDRRSGGDSGTVTLIDAKTAKIGWRQIDVGGDLEFAAPDGKRAAFR